MNTQPSCKERINAHWADLRHDLDTYRNDADVYEDGNDDLPPFCEYGLSFDYVAANTFNDQPQGYWRYQLSWGGPSDEIRFFGDPQGNIYCAEYWFMDWFDGAPLDVTDQPCIQWLIEFFGDVGSFDHALEQAEE